MAYWWVNQGKTDREERAGGYLWAPLKDAAGHDRETYKTMERVQAGDIVFSYVDRSIISVAVATAAAVVAPRPVASGTPGELVPTSGRKVDVCYTDLQLPLALSGVVKQLRPLLPSKYSPLDQNGNGAEGYLYTLPARAGTFLLDKASATQPMGEAATDVIGEAVARAVPDQTQRMAIVQSRIGQGQFRADVLQHWGHRCAVTSCALPDMLRASHIKPWRDSNNVERLDANNGLALVPNLDAAFDRGLITFEDIGDIKLSPHFSPADAKLLGIDTGQHLVRVRVRNEHLSYLAYHRKNIFLT